MVFTESDRRQEHQDHLWLCVGITSHPRDICHLVTVVFICHLLYGPLHLLFKFGSCLILKFKPNNKKVCTMYYDCHKVKKKHSSVTYRA